MGCRSRSIPNTVMASVIVLLLQQGSLNRACDTSRAQPLEEAGGLWHGDPDLQLWASNMLHVRR
jgi:hypothetical protein